MKMSPASSHAVANVAFSLRKPVTRMNGVGAMLLRRCENAVNIEIALGGRRRADMLGLIGQPDVQRAAVGVGKNRDAGDIHIPQRPNDTHRDLAAVGDQNLPKHTQV